MVYCANMELFSAKKIKEFLAPRGDHPKKQLGQNFLADKNILEKIIAQSGVGPQDTVLEIGPGLGTLTKALAEHAKQVITVEKDPAMVQALTEQLAGRNNVTIIHQDVMDYQAPEGPYKIIANIPYYLTSPIIRKFLEAANPPQDMVFMVQKEVAQRICSMPPDMNLLAVSVQYYAVPKILFTVSKHSFWPVPNVDSAIIKITPTKERPNNPDTFFKVVKAGFSHPRKQLANNLSGGLGISKQAAEQWLTQNNIAPNRRAETLTVQDWQNLAQTALQA